MIVFVDCSSAIARVRVETERKAAEAIERKAQRYAARKAKVNIRR